MPGASAEASGHVRRVRQRSPLSLMHTSETGRNVIKCSRARPCWCADGGGRVDLGPLAGGVSEVAARLREGGRGPYAPPLRRWTLPWSQPAAPATVQIAADSAKEVLQRSVLQITLDFLSSR